MSKNSTPAEVEIYEEARGGEKVVTPPQDGLFDYEAFANHRCCDCMAGGGMAGGGMAGGGMVHVGHRVSCAIKVKFISFFI